MSGENVMPKIAAALGVAVNEPFAVCNSLDNTIEWYKVTVDGMQHFAPSTNGFSTLNGIKGDWYHADYILEPFGLIIITFPLMFLAWVMITGQAHHISTETLT